MSEKEGTSHLVWAEKFKLGTHVSIKKGTWKVNGDRVGDKGKLVSRQFVRDMNEVNEEGHSLKNMIYVIDEKKTAELMEQREENIKKNAIQKKREEVSQGDIVGALGNLANSINGNNPQGGSDAPKPFTEMTLKELKIYCIENDIDHHPSAQEANIIGKIEESLKQA